jgi:hypothetical protein
LVESQPVGDARAHTPTLEGLPEGDPVRVVGREDLVAVEVGFGLRRQAKHFVEPGVGEEEEFDVFHRCGVRYSPGGSKK